MIISFGLVGSIQKEETMEKQLNLLNDYVPCHTSLTMQQFLVKTQIQTIPQISLCATSGSSRDSGLGSKITVLHLQKKFNRTSQLVSHLSQKRTFRGASSNSSTAGAGVHEQKGSTSRVIGLGFIHILFFYKLCINPGNFLILPHRR
jgi:hypothetical protein